MTDSAISEAPGVSCPTLATANRFDSFEKFTSDFIAALEKVHYPYSATHRRTVLDHVQDIGLKKRLLNRNLLLDLKVCLGIKQLNDQEWKMRQSHRSDFNHSIEFHRRMLRALLTQATRVRALLKKHSVDEAWARSYLTAVDEQIEKELRGAFPDHPYPLEELKLDRMSDAEVRQMIFDTLHNALGKYGRKRIGNLCIELTALICSLPDCAATGKLHVTPDAVKTALRRSKRGQK